jgi:hypothetical protein
MCPKEAIELIKSKKDRSYLCCGVNPPDGPDLIVQLGIVLVYVQLWKVMFNGFLREVCQVRDVIICLSDVVYSHAIGKGEEFSPGGLAL